MRLLFPRALEHPWITQMNLGRSRGNPPLYLAAWSCLFCCKLLHLVVKQGYCPLEIWMLHGEKSLFYVIKVMNELYKVQQHIKGESEKVPIISLPKDI